VAFAVVKKSFHVETNVGGDKGGERGGEKRRKGRDVNKRRGRSDDDKEDPGNKTKEGGKNSETRRAGQRHCTIRESGKIFAAEDSHGTTGGESKKKSQKKKEGDR